MFLWSSLFGGCIREATNFNDLKFIIAGIKSKPYIVTSYRWILIQISGGVLVDSQKKDVVEKGCIVASKLRSKKVK